MQVAGRSRTTTVDKPLVMRPLFRGIARDVAPGLDCGVPTGENAGPEAPEKLVHVPPSGELSITLHETNSCVIGGRKTVDRVANDSIPASRCVPEG